VIPVTVPTIITTAISSITVTGASSGGNVTNDGGASVTVRGVVWSTSSGPTVALSTKTTDGTGTGSFSSTLASLTASSTYYVRAYATNSIGTAYGNEVSFTTSFSCGTSTVSDIDGNTYNTVSVGSQCWMKVNLKTSRYRNGGSIPNVTDNSTWSTLTTGAWNNYDNDLSNNDIYGKLYNSYTTLGDTLCPSGWHVPSDSDWNKLVKFIDSGADTSVAHNAQSSIAGGKMKSTDTYPTSSYGWNGTNTGATNESGFSALPGGLRNGTTGIFSDIRSIVVFWSATVANTSSVWDRNLNSSSGAVTRTYDNKSLGASVRCLRD
jgi:uncharacterized protein (TIGR02145 family)